MTNNQLCNLILVISCCALSFCMGLVFFGITPAVWGIIISIILAIFGLYEYEQE